MPASRLINVRAPNADESEAGAEIVFARVSDGVTAFIKASYCDGSYQQWGASTPILGDNVEAVTLWADGMRAVHELIRAEDDEDEDEADTKGWEVGDRCDVPNEADRGEITAFVTPGDDGDARVKVTLDCGGEVEVSVDELDILYDEDDAARPY